jgi:hypothetical protein
MVCCLNPTRFSNYPKDQKIFDLLLLLLPSFERWLFFCFDIRLQANGHILLTIPAVLLGYLLKILRQGYCWPVSLYARNLCQKDVKVRQRVQLRLLAILWENLCFF